jgi:predicted  nucleic acid-binding Zn-ribbon protein
MSIETIVAISVPLIALIFTALTFKKNADKETGASAAERATMNANISYIRTSIDEIKLDNKAIQKDVSELSKKVIEIESSVKAAHTRIDDMMKG